MNLVDRWRGSSKIRIKSKKLFLRFLGGVSLFAADIFFLWAARVSLATVWKLYNSHFIFSIYLVKFVENFRK